MSLSLDNGVDSVIFASNKGFEFSALHYTIEELDRREHDFELEKSDSTEVFVCYKNRGVGSGICGPVLLKKYQVTDMHIEFNFDIM